MGCYVGENKFPERSAPAFATVGPLHYSEVVRYRREMGGVREKEVTHSDRGEGKCLKGSQGAPLQELSTEQLLPRSSQGRRNEIVHNAKGKERMDRKKRGNPGA